MALKAFLVAVLVAIAVVPSMAAVYMVGDGDGWSLKTNYTQWAAGKTFHVGDQLMFMYNPDDHNVLKVDGPTFQKCETSNKTGLLKSGKDLITLAKPGRKWYICAVNDHCTKGMKLVINVDATAQAPVPMPPQAPGSSGAQTPGPSGAPQISPFKSAMLIVAVVAVFKMLFA